MSKFKKVIHILSEIEDAFVFLICVLLFLIGLYALIDSYLVYQHANDTSLLKHKPGYEAEEVDREIVGNMVAWVSLEGTNIDYPVMQGINNEEYLKIHTVTIPCQGLSSWTFGISRILQIPIL